MLKRVNTISLILLFLWVGTPFLSRSNAQVSNSNPDHRLFKAAREGDLKIVQDALQQGADVNITTQIGETALMAAVQGGYADIVKILLEHGADVNAKRRNGWTVLMTAIENEDLNIINMLLEHGADPNAETKSDWTALTSAASKGNIDITQALLKHGAHKGVTKASKLAEMEEYPEVARLLKEASRRRMLVYAVIMILVIGGFVVIRWKIGKTHILHQPSHPIHHILRFLYNITAGKKVILYVLLGILVWLAIQIFPRQPSSSIGVLQGAKVGDIQAVEVALKNEQQLEGEIFRFETYGNRFNYVEKETETTALMYAAMNGHADIVKLLLDYGAMPETENREYRTALTFAIEHGHIENVRLLLDYGADVNQKMRKAVYDQAKMGGITPLMVAVITQHPDAVTVLIEYGADVNATNKQGQTALQLAESKDYTETVRILKKAGAK